MATGLKRLLAAICFGVTAFYFWPDSSDKLESSSKASHEANSSSSSSQATTKEEVIEFALEVPVCLERESIVVPTLDSAIQEAKNTIWCASFELCMEKARQELGIKTQVKEGSSEASSALFASIPESSIYMDYGNIGDGILERIDSHAGSAEAKPSSRIQGQFGSIVYAKMKIGFDFKTPYFRSNSHFRSSAKTSTRINSFGIPEGSGRLYSSRASKLKKQAKILYSPAFSLREYIVELDSTSGQQVVLAKISAEETLQACYAKAEKLIALNEVADFGFGDQLTIPRVELKMQHDFKDYLNKRSDFKGAIQAAWQDIDFSLSRRGVSLRSQALIHVKSASMDYRFTSPFLLYVKKRGAALPYFVAWIDNAELLSKR